MSDWMGFKLTKDEINVPIQGRSTPVKNGAAKKTNRFGTGGFAPGADAY